MRPIIIIGSCWGYEGNSMNEVARRTWLTSCSIPYRFVLGGPRQTTPADAISFDVDDGYMSLGEKMLMARRWAFDRGHDWIFQCFTDTYVHVDRLMSSRFEQFDYYGHFPKENLGRHELAAIGCYASGGTGYWLSPTASRALLDAGTPDHWAEDLWTGRVMARHGLRGAHDDRFLFKGGWTRDAITSHLSKGTNQYEPQWMSVVHKLRRGEK